MLSYYSDAGLLRTVQAEGELEEITQRLLDRTGPGGQGRAETGGQEIRGRPQAPTGREVPRPQAGAPQAGAQGEEVGGTAPARRARLVRRCARSRARLARKVRRVRRKSKR